MGANQSNLSSTGFDYVVAVTQDSINATLEHYLYYSGLPEVILCYVYDKHNQPQPIPFATFLKQANNTDPFTIQDGTASGDARVQAVSNANFAFAIKAKLGLPPGVPPAKLPPIVALKPGQSNVTYTLLFAEFVAAEIIYGRRNSMTWFKQCQPAGKSWTFFGAVDLNFQTADFAKLPLPVQAKLKGLGDPSTFSVQQLYYDLNSSNLEQGFQFNNVPLNSILNTFMTASFINTYWKVLKASGSGTILGYGAKKIASPSLLAVTDLNFFVPEPVGNAGPPLMLNYLCATNNHPLPGTSHAEFGWNWLEHGEATQYHGVAALNRNTFALWINSLLADYVSANCYQPTVKIDPVTGSIYVSLSSNQTPTVTYPPSGSAIVSYSQRSPVSRDHSGYENVQCTAAFDLSASVQGDKLVIVQRLVIWGLCRAGFLFPTDSGHIVDTQITDTYTIGVDDQGRLLFSTPSPKANPPTSVTKDQSINPADHKVLAFFFDVVNGLQGLAAATLRDVALPSVGNFIFPGGSVFSFMDVNFSDNQDLVSHFTYANPS